VITENGASPVLAGSQIEEKTRHRHVRRYPLKVEQNTMEARQPFLEATVIRVDVLNMDGARGALRTRSSALRLTAWWAMPWAPVKAG